MKKHCFCVMSAVLLTFIAKADTTITYSRNLPGTTDDAVLFQDAQLLAVSGISLDIRNYFGNALKTLSLSNIVADDAGVDGIYHYFNNGSTLEAHFEWKNSGYNFGLLLILTQDGNDIRGRVAKVCYPGGAYGTDLNNQGSGSCRYFMSESDQDNYKSSGTFSISCKNLTLTFVATESHTVTFVDWNGAVLDTQTVAFGGDATPPADPSRANYVFVGWDTDYTGVTENLTVTALYHALYTVTFLDVDGTPLDTQTVEEGTSATAPDMTGHTYNSAPFSGWNADFSSVSGDLTVTAVYAPIPDQVLAAVAAGNLPAGALIWGGDDGDTWDASSFNWYTTDSLATVWRADAIAVFPTSGAVHVSGGKNVGGFIVALDSDVALSGDALSLASGAEAIFNSDGSLSISNDVACADSFVQRVRDAHDGITSLAESVYLSPNEERRVLPASARLAEITTLKCKVDSHWGSDQPSRELTNDPVTDKEGFYKWEYDSETDSATCQLKIFISGSYQTIVTCVKIRFTQKTDGIWASVVYVKAALGQYDRGTCSSVWEIDFDDGNYRSDGKVKDQDETLSNYHVRVYDFSAVAVDELPTDVRVTIAGDFDGSLVVSNGVFEVADDATLSGGNFTKSIVMWNDGTVLFGSSASQTLVTDIQAKGTGAIKLLQGSNISLKEPSSDHAYNLLIAGDASATGYKTLPANGGSTTVLPGGSLALDRFSSYWGPMAGAHLIVQTNGLLRLINENSIGVSKPIYLEGGTLSNEVNKANILYQLYMNDGARVSGTGFQVGFKDYYNKWSSIEVGGSLPSLIDAESLMVGFQYPADSGKPIGVKFIVADVTDSEATDLLVASPITERTGVTLFNEGYRDNLGVWKQGPGTLELTSPANDCTTGVFKVEAGTVRLGAGCGGGFGALIVLGNAAIDCAGGTIAFEDSADMVWTEGATLSITGNMGKRTIRVGTDGNSLTADQLATIKYVNAAGKAKSVSLTEDGYLLPPPRGMSLVIR